jgi:hypothetical protein
LMPYGSRRVIHTKPTKMHNIAHASSSNTNSVRWSARQALCGVASDRIPRQTLASASIIARSKDHGARLQSCSAQESQGSSFWKSISP